MSRQSLVKARSFYVATKYFCVAIEFGQDQEFLCLDKIFLCRDRVSQGDENLCRDRVFLCRDRVWPRKRILGRDRLFSCRDRVWYKGQESLRRDKEFDVATELLEICIATKSSRT